GATTLSSNLTLSGSSANIALGTNYLSGDGDDEGVFIDSSGNVFIGTTASMLAPLNITGDTASIEDRHEGIWMRSKTGGYIVQLNVRGPRLEIGGGGNLDTTPAMSVNYLTSNVGIGTATPGQELDVIGDIQVGGIASPAYYWNPTGTGDKLHAYTGAEGYLVFSNIDAGITWLTLNRGGGAVFGGSVEAQSLHINGAGSFDGNLSTTGNVIGGNVTSGTDPGHTHSGAGGATTELDNLGTVAVNTDIISDTDSTDDLGSGAKAWAETYTDDLIINTIDGNILVVGDGGGDYTTIDLACNAADPGDEIWVTEGTWSPFTLDDDNIKIIGKGAREAIIVTAVAADVAILG
ncbi:hypothetical protein LCGC14_3088150, partial [marine sediment metagenome]